MLISPEEIRRCGPHTGRQARRILQWSENGFDRRPRLSRTIARRPMQEGLDGRTQRTICSTRCLARTRGFTTSEPVFVCPVRGAAHVRASRFSPNEWQKTVFHFCLILRIAWKVLSQEAFLIEEPPDEDGQDEKKCEESPPRAECERYAEQHDECRGIHRMPHESIGARRDDRLVFGDLNRRGAVAVFLEHEKDEQEPKGDQGIPQYRHRCRHR